LVLDGLVCCQWVRPIVWGKCLRWVPGVFGHDTDRRTFAFATGGGILVGLGLAWFSRSPLWFFLMELVLWWFWLIAPGFFFFFFVWE